MSLKSILKIYNSYLSMECMYRLLLNLTSTKYIGNINRAGKTFATYDAQRKAKILKPIK